MMKAWKILGAAALIALPVLPAAAAPDLAAFANAPCQASSKVIIFLKRKPGTTHEAFRAYYESHHAPWAMTLISKYLVDYRRNFIDQTDAVAVNPAKVDYDVVTELWFRTKADREAMYAYVGQPEIWSQIAADEEKFMDRPASRQMIVDECQTKW